MKRKLNLVLISAALCIVLTGCGLPAGSGVLSSPVPYVSAASFDPLLTAAKEFTDRDMEQTVELHAAKTIRPESGRDVTITEPGVYVLAGTAEDTAIIVDAGNQEKVQLVLDGLSITNESRPCIYVKSADKVFVTTARDSENTLCVTGMLQTEDGLKADAAVFAKDSLTLNGLGTLTISSGENGVSCWDDLKITGGTVRIDCAAHGMEANDSIRIAGGDIAIVSGKDGLHAENGKDDSLGYVYVLGGTLDIRTEDDAIHAEAILQIDGGDLLLRGREGLEGTYVQLNGGRLRIEAGDDGVNGARKSSAFTPTIEVNGGEIVIVMGEGDTDGMDSNGNLYINGGTLDITARCPFDYDGEGRLNGGTVTANGRKTTVLSNRSGSAGGK